MPRHGKMAIVPVAEPATHSRLWRYALSIAGLLCLIPLLVPVISARDARLLMYPYGATLELIPIFFCLRLARKQVGMARMQWRVLAAHFAMLSLSLWSPSAEIWLGWPSVQKGSWLISGFSATASMICLLCFSVFAGGLSVRKRVVDALMALMLCGLNFRAAFSTGPSGFSQYHLQVTVLTAAFLLVCAEASRRSATTAAQRRFAEITEIYLASRFVMLFLIDIVDYTWLPTPMELPFDLIYGAPYLCFSLVALHTLISGAKWKRPSKPAAVWGNILPSLILLATVTLALRGVATYPVFYSIAILLSVAGFVVRTHFLYQRMLLEQQGLLVRTGHLEQLATRDSLTGIGNRRWLEQVAFELLEAGPPMPASLLLIDTDQFKQINDTFGHAAGDNLLKAIGEELRDQTANIERACCARIGGDEFASLLPQISLEEAAQVAEALRQRAHTFSLEGEMGHCSVSIGVASANGRVPLAGLLEMADVALYRAKERGRDVVEVAPEDAGIAYEFRENHGRRRFRPRA